MKEDLKEITLPKSCEL